MGQTAGGRPPDSTESSAQRAVTTRGVGDGVGEKEVQAGGDTRIHTADSLRHTAETNIML